MAQFIKELTDALHEAYDEQEFGEFIKKERYGLKDAIDETLKDEKMTVRPNFDDQNVKITDIRFHTTLDGFSEACESYVKESGGIKKYIENDFYPDLLSNVESYNVIIPESEYLPQEAFILREMIEAIEDEFEEAYQVGSSFMNDYKHTSHFDESMKDALQDAGFDSDVNPDTVRYEVCVQRFNESPERIAHDMLGGFKSTDNPYPKNYVKQNFYQYVVSHCDIELYINILDEPEDLLED